MGVFAAWGYRPEEAPLPFLMARNKSKNKKKKSGAPAPKATAPAAPTEASKPDTAPPAGASLGTRRGLRPKVEKINAKEQAALAKKAARARWDERMTAEGR
jgi:hypothetical protein